MLWELSSEYAKALGHMPTAYERAFSYVSFHYEYFSSSVSEI